MRKGIRVEESGARRGWSATVRSLVRPESWARRLDCGYRRWARRPGRGRCRRHGDEVSRSPRRERDAAARAAERYRQQAQGEGMRLPVLQRGLDRRLGERLAGVPERGTWGRKEEREEDEGRAQRGCNPPDRRCRVLADTLTRFIARARRGAHAHDAFPGFLCTALATDREGLGRPRRNVLDANVSCNLGQFCFLR
jgi:hypothetical protein